MSFPGALPFYTAPTAGETLQAGGHTALHIAEETDILAIATKIGTGASTPTSGLVLRGNGAGTSTWGQVVLTTDVTGVLPVLNGGTGASTASVARTNLGVNTLAELLPSIYPIGCIYTEVAGVNPNTTFGFGTWAQFGQGQVLVGQKPADTDFQTVLAVGGEKTHQLITTEMPAHTHPPAAGSTQFVTVGAGAVTVGAGANITSTNNTGSTGGDGAHNNLQPFIVVFMWRRTA